IDLLQKAKSFSKSEFYLGYDLANLYSLKMDYKKSAEEFITILKADERQLPSVEARIFTYAAREEALTGFINVFEDEQPEDFPAIGNILAKLYSANRQYADAFSLYKTLDENGIYKGSELFSFALKLSAEKEFAFASEVFSYLLKKYPGSPLQQQIKLNFAKNLEAKLESENVDSSQLWKSFPTKKYFPESLYRESLSIYKEIAEKNPFSDIGVEAMYHVGYLYTEKIADETAAGEYLNKVISNFSLSTFYAEACLEKAVLQIQKGDKEGVLTFYEQILTNPRSSEEQKNKAKFLKARMVFFKGEFSESNKLLRQLVSSSKDNISNDALELSFLLTSAFNDSLTLVKFGVGDFA
ncbi:MAG: hypothetical protein Q8L04_08400, partial [Ignavibacteria bacterium]|nr:hypothetical protein [Ignavibacteria bacterium]